MSAGMADIEFRVIKSTSLFSCLGPIVFDNMVGSIGFFEAIEHILFVVMILSAYAMLRSGQ